MIILHTVENLKKAKNYPDFKTLYAIPRNMSDDKDELLLVLVK